MENCDSFDGFLKIKLGGKKNLYNLNRLVMDRIKLSELIVHYIGPTRGPYNKQWSNGQVTLSSSKYLMVFDKKKVFNGDAWYLKINREHVYISMSKYKSPWEPTEKQTRVEIWMISNMNLVLLWWKYWLTLIG